ncbi:conserved protein of unknown function [Kingella kingae]|nr:conserved protein of unknown function [Kingella kingae]
MARSIIFYNIYQHKALLYVFKSIKIIGVVGLLPILSKDKTNIQNWNELKDKPIAVQGDSLSQTQLAATNITSKPIPVKTVYLGVTQVADGNAVAMYI